MEIQLFNLSNFQQHKNFALPLIVLLAHFFSFFWTNTNSTLIALDVITPLHNLPNLKGRMGKR